MRRIVAVLLPLFMAGLLLLALACKTAPSPGCSTLLCKAEEICKDGLCQTCFQGFVGCKGLCVSTPTEEAHRGGCGNDSMLSCFRGRSN